MKVEMDFGSSNWIPSYPKVKLHNSREISSFFYRLCPFLLLVLYVINNILVPEFSL